MDRVYRLFCSLAVLAILGLLAYFAMRTVSPADLRDQIAFLSPLGPIFFILLKASTDIFAPLSGTPYYILAEPLFGLWWGTIYTFIGDAVGYSACFALARIYGQRLVERMAGPRAQQKLERLHQRVGGWKGLLYARLLVPGLQDVVSYAAGLTPLPFSQYATVTLLVVLPQSVLLVATGGAIFRIVPAIAIAYAIIALTLSIAIWIGGSQKRAGSPRTR